MSEQPRDHIVRHRWSVESVAFAGIVYAVAAGIALILFSGYPRPDLPDADLTAWFADGGNRFRLLLALNLGMIGAIAFIWFVAVLRHRVGSREDRFFATVFYGSAIIYVVFWVAALAALAAIPAAIELFDAPVRVDSGAVGSTGGFAAALLFVAGPRIQALFVMSTSTIFLRTKAAPRWLGIVGYVFGLILFVVPILTKPSGLAFPIWVFIASITILVNKRFGDDAEPT